MDVSEHSAALADPGPALLALYDTALPHVYGYLLARCGGVARAEDLTAETFLAAREVRVAFMLFTGSSPGYGCGRSAGVPVATPPGGAHPPLPRRPPRAG